MNSADLVVGLFSVPTTVSCVSSSVSQTRLLESRGMEQSEPAQLCEQTHTPRD